VKHRGGLGRKRTSDCTDSFPSGTIESARTVKSPRIGSGSKIAQKVAGRKFSPLTARRSHAPKNCRHDEGKQMKENITLRLDKDLIKKAKGIASKRDISLNRLLSDFLKQIVDQEE
jgi:uncharacterized protein (DUF4415 family)